MIPSKVQVWIQIHKLPPLYSTEVIVSQLAWKVGEVTEVGMRAIPGDNGDFHRARIRLESSKPLVRFVSLAPVWV